jgi:ABC-2 type transport system ATP-binding protein
MTPPAPAVRVRDLHKSYGKLDAVRGISFEIPRGICLGLLGPNGAGKTTTVEILEGLLEPSSGEVEVLGLDWARHAAEIRERLGVCLQQTALPDKLTVRELVSLFRNLYRRGLPPDDVIGQVGLEEKAAARYQTLSGGQKQRLALACALVADPELLFLDEPTTGLDPQSRRQVWDLVAAFKASGRTVLLTTHYMDEAERLCDTIEIVDHGRVIARGTPRELIVSLGGDHVVEVELLGDGALALQPEALAALPSVKHAQVQAGRLTLAVGEPHIALPALLAFFESRGLPLASLHTRHASLEDVFVSLTGRHLREA